MYKETVKSNTIKGIKENKKKKQEHQIKYTKTQKKISKATGHSTDQREIKNKGTKLDKSRYMSRF